MIRCLLLPDTRGRYCLALVCLWSPKRAMEEEGGVNNVLKTVVVVVVAIITYSNSDDK